MGRAYIGTSGFSYKHWREEFYPPQVPQREWLEYYATHFETVELNNTFYAMPRGEVCESWRRRTPARFNFAVKLNRIFTHRFRLMGHRDTLVSYLDAVERLGEKLGPILIQLPPHWNANPPRLDEFLGDCPRRHRWAVEFRDPSWLCEDVHRVLRSHNAALCVHDMLADHPQEVTADWAYIRCSGGGRYSGDYPDSYLSGQAEFIRGLVDRGLDVYTYFNNDIGCHAIRNAQTLRQMMGMPKAVPA